jgi:hypothetical protein
MEDIEKELGPLLDNYNKKYEEFKNDSERKVKETNEFEGQFKTLINTVIRPEMEKYKQLLDKRGFSSLIKVEPEHGFENKSPKISLTFSYKKTKSYATSHPSITFSADGKTIRMYENKFDPGGSGGSGERGSFEINQITPELVREKLNDFLRSLFSREWQSYDFE